MDRLTILIILFITYFGLSGQVSEYQLIMINNQPQYIPGDTVFFGCYLVDADLNLDAKRRIAKVSLVDESETIHNEINVLFEDGIAVNQMALPNTLEGRYLSVKFTFHGPYFGEIEGVIPLNVGLGQGDLQPNMTDESGTLNTIKGPVDIELNENNAQIRQHVDLKLKVESSNAAQGLSKCILNVINTGAYPIELDPNELFSSISIQLTDKPQARIIKQGRAYHPISGDVIPDSTQLIFYQQSTRRLYQAFTSSGGNFRLELLDFFGGDRLLIGANVNGDLVKDVKVDWDRLPLRSLSNSETVMNQKELNEYAVYRTNQKKIDNSYDFFLSEDDFTVTKLFIPPLNLEGDVVYDVTKFIIFNDVPELISTVIHALYFGEIDGQEVVRIKFMEETLTAGDPLYFIDGVATFDTQKLLRLSPESIQSIKVISNKRKLVRFGSLGNYGIVIVETDQPEANQFSTHELVVGLNEPIQVQQSSKESINNPKPIFKVNPYWNPDVEFESRDQIDLSFYTSDDAGDYLVWFCGYFEGKGLFTSQKKIKVEVE